MAIIQVPEGLSIARQSWEYARLDLEFRSLFGAQAVEVAAPLWSTTITASLKRPEQWQSLMLRLRGRTNQLALWNHGRPVPLGSMRGVMVLGATAQGATALVITADGQGGKTLLTGDFLGLGSGLTQQVVMVTGDAVADAAGAITVAIEPALRNGFAAGSVVTWDRPCALFRSKSPRVSWEYEPGVVKGMSLDLLEDWRP